MPRRKDSQKPRGGGDGGAEGEGDGEGHKPEAGCLLRRHAINCSTLCWARTTFRTPPSPVACGWHACIITIDLSPFDCCPPEPVLSSAPFYGSNCWATHERRSPNICCNSQCICASVVRSIRLSVFLSGLVSV